MSSLLITPAVLTAVTAADVRAHLRIADASEDAYLGTLIAAAQRAAENFTNRAIGTQKWRLTLWAFDGRERFNPRYETPAGRPYPDSLVFVRGAVPIALLPVPVVSVDTFTYLDENGVRQTLASSAYIFDATSEPAILVPAYGATWPNVQNMPGAIVIETTNGYGDMNAVDPRFAQAMLIAIGNWYENRENAGDLPDASKALLWPLRVWG